jgi:hypothetical protein
MSFGSWDAFPTTENVVQICHPDWRGVRTSTYGFRSPVIECDDLTLWSDLLSDRISKQSIDTVVIQGWPPGAGRFAARLADIGIRIKCVLHSSPAQHGAEPGEAAVVDEVLGLASRGTLAEVGMVKAGVAMAFRELGHPVSHVPNRAPHLPDVTPLDLGPGLHVGVFAAPFWRKNVATQLLALPLIGGAVGHVMERPSVEYLAELDIVEHGELPWPDFIALEGSVDVNLYVTLTECHPLSPIESYLLGVPCLMSRTSGVFADDEELWEATTVDRPDDPEAIAAAARELIGSGSELVDRARAWISRADADAADAWREFIGR